MIRPLEMGSGTMMQGVSPSTSIPMSEGVASGVGGMPITRTSAAHSTGDPSVVSRIVSAVLRAMRYLWNTMSSLVFGSLLCRASDFETPLIACVNKIEAHHATNEEQLFVFTDLLRRGHDALELDNSRGRNSRAKSIAKYCRRGYDALSFRMKEQLDLQLFINTYLFGGSRIIVNKNTNFNDRAILVAAFTLYLNLPSVALNCIEFQLPQASDVEKQFLCSRLLRIRETPLEPKLTIDLIEKRVDGIMSSI